MTRLLTYALPLALGALAACGVFASAEAVDRSGHNPFSTPAPADNDAHAPGKSVGGEIE